MGIDLASRGRIKNKNKQNTRSKNLYQHLLIKVTNPLHLTRFVCSCSDSCTAGLAPTSRRPSSGDWSRRAPTARHSPSASSLNTLAASRNAPQSLSAPLLMTSACLTCPRSQLQLSGSRRRLAPGLSRPAAGASLSTR